MTACGATMRPPPHTHTHILTYTTDRGTPRAAASQPKMLAPDASQPTTHYACVQQLLPRCVPLPPSGKKPRLCVRARQLRRAKSSQILTRSPTQMEGMASNSDTCALPAPSLTGILRSTATMSASRSPRLACVPRQACMHGAGARRHVACVPGQAHTRVHACMHVDGCRAGTDQCVGAALPAACTAAAVHLCPWGCVRVHACAHRYACTHVHLPIYVIHDRYICAYLLLWWATICHPLPLHCT